MILSKRVSFIRSVLASVNFRWSPQVKQLLIKKMLYGHTDAVTCLAASPDWSVAVSGSRDRTAIIWDLSRYCYVKHLAGHAGPVAAVTVNELTGDIVTCAGSWLYLWDINGRLQVTLLLSSHNKLTKFHAIFWKLIFWKSISENKVKLAFFVHF